MKNIFIIYILRVKSNFSNQNISSEEEHTDCTSEIGLHITSLAYFTILVVLSVTVFKRKYDHLPQLRNFEL